MEYLKLVEEEPQEEIEEEIITIIIEENDCFEETIRHYKNNKHKHKVFYNHNGFIQERNKTRPDIDKVCYICGKTINKVEDLKIHLKNHKEHVEFVKKTGTCPSCLRTFESQHELFQHFYLKHGLFLCIICHKIVNCAPKLSFHLMKHRATLVENAVKNESGQYVCTICDKIFKFKTSLRYHMFLHNGEKPHVCETCGKRFRKPYDLKLHNYTHTKEYPFKCAICGTGFAQKSTLTNHLKKNLDHDGGLTKNTNNSVTCRHCNALFISQSAYKKHMENINSLGNVEDFNSIGVLKSCFHCIYCDESFTERKVYLKHVNKRHVFTQ